ncbi:VPLPA-CTERM sorting domain-containing protein [Thioclava kandeliae]|uniref:VPLPA-CTERM sorting domain-containing protein n=1 Tax=Thioclava kandeliae TaxID=3070818 RepID=A0ABV1SMF8_9RHOB
MKAQLKTAAIAAIIAVGSAAAASAATYSGTFSLSDGQNITYADYTIADSGLYSFTIDAGTGVYGLDGGTYSQVSSFVDSGDVVGFYLTAGTTYDFTFTAFSDVTATYTIETADGNTDLSAVPLPATLPLLAGALGVAGFAARRRKKAA